MTPGCQEVVPGGDARRYARCRERRKGLREKEACYY